MYVGQRWTVSWKITRLVSQRSDVAVLNGDETLTKEKSQRSARFMCALFVHQSSCKLCLANPAPRWVGGSQPPGFGTHLPPLTCSLPSSLSSDSHLDALRGPSFGDIYCSKSRGCWLKTNIQTCPPSKRLFQDFADSSPLVLLPSCPALVVSQLWGEIGHFG